MATLQKIGYKQTGYSEPFTVPTGQTITSGTDLDTLDFGIDDPTATAILYSVPIENTEYRNSVMYVRANDTSAGTTITSNDCNVDNSGYGGKWILTDDDGLTYVTIESITYAPAIYGDVVGYPDQDDSEKGEYTITVSDAFNAVSGTAYRVVARQLDVGDATASRNYVAGERVVESVLAVGAYDVDAPAVP